MRKKLFGRILSVILSASMAFSPSLTAFATDNVVEEGDFGVPETEDDDGSDVVTEPEEVEPKEVEPEDPAPAEPGSDEKGSEEDAGEPSEDPASEEGQDAEPTEESDEVVIDDEGETMGDGDTPVSSHHKVTYVYDDGKTDDYETQTDTVTVEGSDPVEKITAPTTNPTRTGYEFVDWFEVATRDATIAEDATKYNFADAVTADTILKAKWKINTYTVSISDESEDLTSITYVVVGVEGDNTAEFTDGAASVSDVAYNQQIKITEWTYKDDAYNMVSGMSEKIGDAGSATPIEPAEDGSYTTSAITADTSISIATANLESDKIKVAKVEQDTDVTPTLTPLDSSIAEVGDKKYVKVKGGFSFELAPAAGTAVSEVKYTIGETTGDAQKSVVSEKVIYTIPEAGLQAAIKAGGATINATVTEASYKVKVAEITDATAEYQEYIVTTDSQGKAVYNAIGTPQDIEAPEQGKTTDITVSTGNVIGITVEKNSGKLIISDSVTADGDKIAPSSEDTGIPGKYLITKASTVSIIAYDPVTVETVEATKGSGTDLKTWTSTSVNTGVGDDNKVTGGAIKFTVDLAKDAGRDGVDNYYADVDAPVVTYNQSSITPTKSESVYTIAVADVEAAIKAKKDITITAKATEKDIEKLTFTINDSGISEVTYSEYASRVDYNNGKDPILTHEISSTSTEGPDTWTAATDTTKAVATGEIQAKNFVVLKVTTTNGFVTVTQKGAKPEDDLDIAERSGDFVLGILADSTDYTLDLLKLAATKVQFKGDTDSTKTAYIQADVAAESKSGTFINAADDLFLDLQVNSTDTVKNYKIKTPISYELAYNDSVGDKTETGSVKVTQKKVETEYGTEYETVYSISKEVVKRAALLDGTITITVNLAEAGYQAQAVTIMQSVGATTKISVNGATVNYNEGIYADTADITYNQNAKFDVNVKDGYKLDEVRYVTAATEAKKKTEYTTDDAYLAWLKSDKAVADKDVTLVTTASFTISKVTEPYYIYIFTSEEYTLLLDGKKVADGTEIGWFYNAPLPASITVKNGTKDETLGSTGAEVTATVPGEKKDDDPVDVSDVFGEVAADATELTFNPKGVDATYGKVVTVKITSNEKVDNTPLFSYTLKFDVTSPVTEDVVDFDDDYKGKTLGLPLGGTAISIPLKTAKKGFNPDCYEAKVSATTESGSTQGIEIVKSLDGKTLSVYADPKYYESLVGELFDIKLYDAVDDTTEISKDKVTFTVTTYQVKNADLKAVKAEADTDSITVDFSGLNKEKDGTFYPNTRGLYYEVKVTQVGTATEGYILNATKYVEASKSSYTIRVTENNDVLSADPVKYTVEVQLVQRYGSAEIERSTDKKTIDDVETVVDSIFATKITFTKNASALKKIFNTMGDITLGTVNFPDAAKNTPVTAKRVSKAEIQDPKTGEVIASTEDTYAPIEIDGNDIVIIPENFGRTGKFNVVAYALEPKGKEVTCKTQINVLKSITGLYITAPDKLYKAPGKAGKITAKVFIYPTNAAVKKVNWEVVDTSNKPIAGVTIKNGTVSIAKNVVIPDGGLKFYIVATAADYEGNDVSDVSSVEVYSTPIDLSDVTFSIGDTILADGGEYYSSEIDGVLDAYPIDVSNIKFTVSGLTAYGKDSVGSVTSAYASKIGKASITAASTDGSKVKKTISFNIKSDEDMEISLRDRAGNEILDDDTNGDFKAINDLAANKPLTLLIGGSHEAQISHSVAFNGFNKKVYNSCDGTYYSITPTKNVATITITDKTNGNAKTVITVTNTQITTAKTTTSVTASNIYETGYNASKNAVITKDAKGKIFNYLNYEDYNAYKAAGSFNKVTYTVTAGGNVVENAIVSIQNDSKSVLRINIFNKQFTPIATEVGVYKVPLDEQGQFVVDYALDGSFDIPKGTYSFTVTPVDDEGNAIAKTATVKVSAAPAPKAKVAVSATKFSKFASEAPISFKTMNNIVWWDESDTKTNVETSAEFETATKGINTAGKINDFATAFAISSEKLTCIATPADPDKANSGWVEYTWTNLDGTTGSASVKVTVSPESKGKIVPVTPPTP